MTSVLAEMPNTRSKKSGSGSGTAMGGHKSRKGDEGRAAVSNDEYGAKSSEDNSSECEDKISHSSVSSNEGELFDKRNEDDKVKESQSNCLKFSNELNSLNLFVSVCFFFNNSLLRFYQHHFTVVFF